MKYHIYYFSTIGNTWDSVARIRARLEVVAPIVFGSTAGTQWSDRFVLQPLQRTRFGRFVERSFTKHYQRYAMPGFRPPRTK